MNKYQQPHFQSIAADLSLADFAFGIAAVHYDWLQPVARVEVHFWQQGHSAGPPQWSRSFTFQAEGEWTSLDVEQAVLALPWAVGATPEGGAS